MSDQKSLVTLAQTSANIEKALIESEGVLTPELETLLAEIDVSLPEKVDNYALIMERMEMVAQHYAARSEMFARMESAAMAVVARCKVNMKFAIETLGTDEVLGHDVKFKLVKTNPSVVIENEDNIDEAYKVTVTTQKIEKKRIAEDLKLGVPVRGARLEQGVSLRKYANTPGSK